MVDSTFYIRNIKYDHFGQRTYILDGDSVETYYEYDPDTRRLSRLLNTSLQANEVLQDNEYEYDNVGNILSITDVGRNPRVQTFSYDDADRLIWSEGEIPNEYSSSILLSYKTQQDYSLAGRLLGKNVESKRLSTAMGLFSVLYDNEYHYDDPNNPYAVSYIRDPNGADHEFIWDANGNLEHSYAHATNTKRYLCWTEDNRLQAFLENGDDGGIAAYYNYTADGERNLKLTSPRISIQQNAALLNGPSLIYPTLYASPLITLTKHGYTKHYFEEGRRICSKIGGGFRNVRVEDFDTHVPEMEFDYGELHQRQKDGLTQTFGYCLGVDPQTEQGVDLHEMLVMVESSRNEQEPAFYYHSDHLGSAAYLTHNGQVTQTLNYLPYGEDWVDIQHYMGTRYSNMELYTFTGKVKDSESGYHYFGSRYYDSEALTGWLSVDPMSDKYPSLSPYNYCAWNPVKLEDPNGKEINPIYDFNGKFQGNTKEGFSGDPIIMSEIHLNALMKDKNIKSTEELSFNDFFYGSTGAILFDIAVAEKKLSIEAQKSIFKDIIDNIGEKDVGGNIFRPFDFEVTYYSEDMKNNAVTNIGVDVKSKTFYISHQYDFYETTVENIQTTILYHEFLGHFVNGWGNENGNLQKSQGGEHYRCYHSVIASPMFTQTTKKFQDFQKRMLDYFSN